MRGSKIRLNKLVFALAICLSLVSAAFSQVSRPKAQSGSAAGVSQSGSALGLAKPQGLQSKLTKPETFPLMIYFLDRYAQSVPDKTNIDRAVERTLAGKNNSRELARQLVAGFRSIPLEERKAAFGELADISARQKISEAQIKNAFKPLSNRLIKQESLPDKLELPLPPNTIQRPMTKQPKMQIGLRMDTQGGSNFNQLAIRNAMFYSEESALHLTPVAFAQSSTRPTLRLYYQGLYCRDETRLLDLRANSDEIYIITTVLEEETGLVQVTRHPRPSTRGYYGGVDVGDVRNEPATPIWSGSPQDLTLVSIAIERDKGTPERFDDLIDAGKRTVQAILTATGVGGPVAGPALELGVEIIKLIVSRILRDDIIAEKYTGISSSDLLRFAHTPMTQWRPSERQPYLDYHFHVRHKGEQADFYVMFGVPPIVDLPAPTPVTVRFHKVKQIGDLDRPIRGQADFKGSITIAGEEHKLSKMHGNEITPTYQWVFTKNVHSENVTITLKLYESDPRREEHCDINPRRGAKDLTFTYNRATGRITGDVGGMRGQIIRVQGAGDNNRADILFSVDWHESEHRDR